MNMRREEERLECAMGWTVGQDILWGYASLQIEAKQQPAGPATVTLSSPPWRPSMPPLLLSPQQKYWLAIIHFEYCSWGVQANDAECRTGSLFASKFTSPQPCTSIRSFNPRIVTSQHRPRPTCSATKHRRGFDNALAAPAIACALVIWFVSA